MISNYKMNLNKSKISKMKIT